MQWGRALFPPNISSTRGEPTRSGPQPVDRPEIVANMFAMGERFLISTRTDRTRRHRRLGRKGKLSAPNDLVCTNGRGASKTVRFAKT